MFFTSPIEWSRQHIFDDSASIWDIPLVKPRFGCTVDISLALRGYDVAKELRRHMDAFKKGARCDRGFIPLDPSTMDIKMDWEYGVAGSDRRIPSLKDYRLSVMYRADSSEAKLVEMSIATVIDRIPEALELVVVVEEVDKELFEAVLDPYRAVSPFPIHVVTERPVMREDIQPKFSKVSGIQKKKLKSPLVGIVL